MGKERAGVLVVSDGRLALIERWKNGRHYWVIPGGTIEPGESIDQAAAREGEEELGAVVALGELRVRIDHREADGSMQRQWYFDARVASELLQMVGPEASRTDSGTYTAVWMKLTDVDPESVLPSAVAKLVVTNGGVWPNQVIEIDEG